jgi:ATP-dependent DNA helicase DinG
METRALEGPSAVDRILGPGGLLAQSFPGYESRAAQLAFAADVARTFDKGGILLAEAPTGVGKSLGYLVPALLWARAQREPVVVSTHTRALQDQLTDVDAPRLAFAFDPAPRVARLKGRANYMCPRRHRHAFAERGPIARAGSALERAFDAWTQSTDTFDLDEFDFGAATGGAALRARVATEPALCNPAACKGTECPWRVARKRAAQAELVIVNHALLVTGLPGAGILPPFRALVLDEAHHFDAVLTAQSTVRQSLSRLESLLALVTGERVRGRGEGADLLAIARMGAEGRLGVAASAELDAQLDRLAALAPALREAGRAFFGQVAASLLPSHDAAYEPRARFRQVEDVIGETYAPLQRLFDLGSEGEEAWRGALSALARAEPTPEIEEVTADLLAGLGAWQEWLAGLKFCTDPKDREFVHWRGGARAETAEIAAAPVEVARRVQTALLPELTSLVLTSATLTTSGSFRFVRERIGLLEDVPFTVEETVYPSPFDFTRQLGAWVHDPGPGRAALADALFAVHAGLGRNTLALFTSHLALKEAAARLKARTDLPGPVWAQEADGNAIELARRFRDARGVLLLGTASFWEGVDFPGDALEVLVVTQLPFPVPTDPLVEARCERMDDAGESSFAHVMVPEAVLRFRQGVGRLVRRQSDKGALVLFDARVVTKSYGVHFRRGLPVALREAARLSLLVSEAREFLAHGKEST